MKRLLIVHLPTSVIFNWPAFSLFTLCQKEFTVMLGLSQFHFKFILSRLVSRNNSQIKKGASAI